MKNKMSGASALAIAAGSILFYTIAMPLLDSFASVLGNKMGLANIKIKKQIEEIDEPEKPLSNAIGFEV